MKLLRYQVHVLSQTFKWLKSPEDSELTISFWRKLQLSASLFTFEVILSLTIIFPVIMLVQHFFVEASTILEPLTMAELLFLMVIVAPLFEEFIIRFFLPYKRNYLAKAINHITRGWVVNNWKQIFKLLVYASASIFGFMHITNFENINAKLLLFSPIIIGSQLIGGLLYAYIRVKLGFFWAVGQHAAWNGILAITMIVFSHNSTILQASHENYVIDIKHLDYVYVDTAKLEYKIEDGIIYEVNANDYKMQDVLNSLGLQSMQLKQNFWTDFNFESSEGVALDQLKDILSDKLQVRK